HGEHAARAAVARITQLPPSAGLARVSASGAVVVPVVETLTRSFYRALEALVVRVREWEAAAADGDTMRPATMAALWSSTLEALDDAGTPAVDAFGRRLELAGLPEDLLEQVDPRRVVSDATRLPEDVESWTQFVRREGR
ncbi:MAG: hypothetical protein ACI9K2_006483, partial [Myxococcota bacterium]